MNYPAAVKTTEDKVEFCYRMHQKLIDWHNLNAKAKSYGEFQVWERTVYIPKEKRLLAELSAVRLPLESTDMTSTEMELREADRLLEKDTYRKSSKWDVEIDIDKV